jgi:hypothetical protein
VALHVDVLAEQVTRYTVGKINGTFRPFVAPPVIEWQQAQASDVIANFSWICILDHFAALPARA